jgi:hypothetical protein
VDKALDDVGALRVLCLPPYYACRDAWAASVDELFRDEAILRAAWDAYDALRGEFELVHDWVADPGALAVFAEIDRRLAKWS